MGSMSLLPEKFSASNERHRIAELPAHHIVPLISLERKIPMRLNLVMKVLVHRSLTGRTDGNWLFQLALATFCHPCDFSCEAFNMLFLNLKVLLGYEDQVIAVAYTECFDLLVKPSFDLLPDRV